MFEGIEEAIKGGTIGDMLRNAPFPAFAMPGLPAEYSNWADEQRSWREAVCLYDQSHHMTDVNLRGPGVIPLLSSIAVNDFSNFPVDTAKQFVAVNHDGYIIGDSIVFRLGEDEYRIVGGPPAPNWVHFHAETRGQDIEIRRDDNSYVRRGDPELYRYQIQGPKALDVMRKVLGTEPPKLKFFAMGHVSIAGRHVRALRHGMAGEPGYELFGPWADGDAVKSALLEAGAEFGIRLVGGLAYITNALESGWIPRPLPAIYSDDPLLAEYRKWLAAAGDPVVATVGGSLASADVTGYYFTPFELGYGKVVKFNHDFIGREALERIVAQGRDKARSKVTLVWNADDAAGLVGSVFQPGPGAKILNLPMPLYATFQFDRVLAGGKDIGRTAFTGYSANERAILALATVDSAYAEPGTEVTVLWGESPNTAKPTVEHHVQVELRATVEPAPITEYARTAYRAVSA
jgi:syringate O-demethylase